MVARSKQTTHSPASNRLSDAPSVRTPAPVTERPPSGRAQRDSLIAFQEMIEPEDLSVVFQPIVRMDRGTVFAYEALVRCRTDKFAAPPVLFEHAVRTSCAGRLGRVIREIAVPLCAGLPIFLNVHPKELSEGWLVRPDDPIFQHDSEVFLEITESVPLTHFDVCYRVLQEVRSRGDVHLVVDDLGAGYSNLKRIADLEPKIVKLDRGLIASVDRSARQRRLVSSVVQLCIDLGAHVVAEGVETFDEYRAIRDTGARFGQGFLFARPGFPMPTVSWPPANPRAALRDERRKGS